MDNKEKQAEQMWGNTDEYKEFKDKNLTNQQLLNSGEQLMQIFKEMGKLKELNPEAKEVQDKIQELKTFITNHYYTCTNETLKALGEMYITDAFKANIDRAGGEGTALYTHEAINAYLKQQEVEITTIMQENTNYIILDVRTIEEYTEGHIPNAICIPNETIDETVTEQLPNKDQLILIYCRSGNRSKQAALKLQHLGYTNLVEFGGIIDWDGEIVR